MMIKHKNRAAAALAALLALSLLAGCGNTDNQPSGDEDTGYRIAVVPKMTDADWFARMEEGVDRFNAAQGTDYTFVGAESGADQAALIEGMLQEDWDAICVVPFDGKALAPLLQQAREQGIVVITHEGAGMDPACFDYDLEAFDNAAYGLYAAQTLADLCNNEGTYLQFTGDWDAPSHDAWCDAADDYFAAHTNMVKLGRYATADGAAASCNQTMELLTENAAITAIQGCASTDIVGAAQAVEKLGLSGKVAITGISMPSLAGDYLRSGTIASFSTWDPACAGEAMVELAQLVLDARARGAEVGEEILSLSADGYGALTPDPDAKGVLYGDARVDITLENLDAYDF